MERLINQIERQRLALLPKEAVIGQWREHLNSMADALRDFGLALPDLTTDEEFMAAYSHLSQVCGDILDDLRLPMGGSIDDLRQAISEMEGEKDEILYQ